MKALHASTVFTSRKMAAGYTRARTRSRGKMRFFIDTWEIKCLGPLESSGLSPMGISDIKKARLSFWSALIQEETREHEVNAAPHETRRTRWQRRLAARPLPPVHTPWGMEVAPLYTLEDV